MPIQQYTCYVSNSKTDYGDERETDNKAFNQTLPLHIFWELAKAIHLLKSRFLEEKCKFDFTTQENEGFTM